MVNTASPKAPIDFLQSETMAPNIGGTAMLIGNPPNLIIGSAAGAAQNGYKLSLMGFLKSGAPVSFVSLMLASVYIVLRHWLFGA